MAVKISSSTKRILNRKPGKLSVLRNEKSNKIKLYDRQRGKCAYCANAFPIQRLTIDHVKRKREGGGSTLDNLVLACPPCNTRRELPANPREVVLMRWAVWHRQYVIDYAL